MKHIIFFLFTTLSVVATAQEATKDSSVIISKNGLFFNVRYQEFANGSMGSLGPQLQFLAIVMRSFLLPVACSNSPTESAVGASCPVRPVHRRAAPARSVR